MIEELQDWRHIWLYAKGHYKRGDLMKDLKVLIGHHAALMPEHVSDEDILIVLCENAIPYLTTEGNVDYRMRKFFEDLIFATHHENRPLTVADIAQKLLSVLSIVRVMDDEGRAVINLGEADYELLPKPQ